MRDIADEPQRLLPLVVSESGSEGEQSGSVRVFSWNPTAVCVHPAEVVDGLGVELSRGLAIESGGLERILAHAFAVLVGQCLLDKVDSTVRGSVGGACPRPRCPAGTSPDRASR